MLSYGRDQSRWDSGIAIDEKSIGELGAGRIATEHLLELGHRRIAYADYAHPSVLPSKHHSAHDRRAGYEHAMQAAGLQPRVYQGFDSLSKSEILAAVLAWLRPVDRPAAVVTYSPRDESSGWRTAQI